MMEPAKSKPRGKRRETHMWKCDVCKLVCFPDFDMAVAHEEACDGSRSSWQHLPSSAHAVDATKRDEAASSPTKPDIEIVRSPSRSISPEIIDESKEKRAAFKTKARKKPIRTPEKLAGIFKKDMDSLLEEQCKAEFQAKRRIERWREQERQKKRARRLNLQDDSDGASVQSSSWPRPKLKPEEAKKLPPLADRFVKMAHVGHFKSNLDVPGIGNYYVQRSAIQSATKLVTHRTKTIASICDGDCTEAFKYRQLEENTFSELLSNALRELFVPLQSQQTTAESGLWVDKYGLDNYLSSPSDVIGDSNKKVAGAMLEWVSQWRKARDAAMERMEARQRKFQGKCPSNLKKSRRQDIDLWDDADDEDGGLPNICFVTGPTGSGKSSLVHAVARASDCSVLEINTTSPRGAGALKNAIQEATQSCSSVGLLQHKAKKSNLPTVRETSLYDTDEEELVQEPESTLTVILIDEVDLLYESNGDAGFWNALSSVAKTAKCPIFLTAQSIPSVSAPFRYIVHHLARPLPHELAPMILKVSEVENFEVCPKISSSDVAQGLLERIADLGKCDVRRILNEMQCLSPQKVEGKDVYQKSDQKTKSPRLASLMPPCLIHRPEILSVSPRKVDPDCYSVLKIRATHLPALISLSKLLHDPVVSNEAFSVRVGGIDCPKALMINDDTLMALCPPMGRDDKMPLSHITTVSVGLVGSKLGNIVSGNKAVHSLELVDGNSMSVSIHPRIEYDVHVDEFEFTGDDENKRTSTDSHSEDAVCQALRLGLELWEKELETFEKVRLTSETTSVPFVADVQGKKNLDELAGYCDLASDAIFLDDNFEGVPVLSGACRGYGFDMVDGEEINLGGQMRKHEKSRPPSEQRLFELGLKDHNFFYGDSDSYVVFPSSKREQRLLRDTMHSYRGSGDPPYEVLAVENDESTVIEDVDDFVRYGSSQHIEEDFLLPALASSPLRSLPMTLLGLIDKKKKKTDILLSHEKTREKLKRAVSYAELLSNLFDSPTSDFKGGRSPLRQSIFTEYVPSLRCIAVHERSKEFPYLQQKAQPEPTTVRRSSRRGGRETYSHYFDTISNKLRLDRTDLGSSRVNSQFADKYLLYKNSNTS